MRPGDSALAVGRGVLLHVDNSRRRWKQWIRDVRRLLSRVWMLTYPKRASTIFDGHEAARAVGNGPIMSIETNEHETRIIMGLFRPKARLKGNAISRLVRVGHPYRVGDRVALGASFKGKMVIYAGGVIRGLLEHSFSERARPGKQMDAYAKAEGYEGAAAWAQAMRRNRPELRPGSAILRLSLDQIRLSPEISGESASVSVDEHEELGEFDHGSPSEPKTMMRVSSLDALAELGGTAPL